jgi:hypothetical protein
MVIFKLKLGLIYKGEGLGQGGPVTDLVIKKPRGKGLIPKPEKLDS